jgi:hypothetical protein
MLRSDGASGSLHVGEGGARDNEGAGAGVGTAERCAELGSGKDGGTSRSSSSSESAPAVTAGFSLDHSGIAGREERSCC